MVSLATGRSCTKHHPIEMLFLLASIVSQLDAEFSMTIVEAVVPNVESYFNQVANDDKTDPYVVVSSGGRECGRTNTASNSLRPYWEHTIDCGCLPFFSKIKVCLFDQTHDLFGSENGVHEIGCIERSDSYYQPKTTGSASGSTVVRDGVSFDWRVKRGPCARPPRPPSPPRPAVGARAAPNDEAGGGVDEAGGGGDEADGGGNGVAPIVGGVVGVCAVLCIGAKLCKKKKKDAPATTSGTKGGVSATSSV
ncbi:hypothetical protein AB1Y20_008573 [Prymnesium parvum]|uniref:C2 domain-containing protein n=1 Tax=Prymnesium parvum TaxID=97485 RepID=A0AB34IST8_PRYPA